MASAENGERSVEDHADERKEEPLANRTENFAAEEQLPKTDEDHFERKQNEAARKIQARARGSFVRHQAQKDSLKEKAFNALQVALDNDDETQKEALKEKAHDALQAALFEEEEKEETAMELKDKAREALQVALNEDNETQKDHFERKQNEAARKIQARARGSFVRHQAQKEALKEKAFNALQVALDNDDETQKEALKEKAFNALQVALDNDDETQKEELKEKARDALKAALLEEEKEEKEEEEATELKDKARDALQAALFEEKEEGEAAESAKNKARDALQAALLDEDDLERERNEAAMKIQARVRGIGVRRDRGLQELLAKRKENTAAEEQLQSTDEDEALAAASSRRALILRDERDQFKKGLVNRRNTNTPQSDEGGHKHRLNRNLVVFPLHGVGGSTKAPVAQAGETKIPDKKWHRNDRPTSGFGDSLIDSGEEEVKHAWRMDLVSDRGQLRSHIYSDLTALDMEFEPWDLLPADVIKQDVMPGEETERGLTACYSSFFGVQRQTSTASSQEPEVPLRPEMHSNPVEFNMELEPWLMLDANVILDDVCTDSQALLNRIREQCGTLSRPGMERRRLAIQKHFDTYLGKGQAVARSNAVSEPRFFEEIRPLGKEVEMVFFSFGMENVSYENFVALANAKVRTEFITTVRETIADLAGYSTLPFQVHVEISGGTVNAGDGKSPRKSSVGNSSAGDGEGGDGSKGAKGSIIVNARIVVPSSLLYLVQGKLCDATQADSGGTVVESTVREQVEQVPGFRERIVVGDRVVIKRASVLSSLDPVPSEDRGNRSDNFIRYVELYDSETGTQAEAILAKIRSLRRSLPPVMAPETVEKKLVYYYTQATPLYRHVNKCLRLDEEEGIKYYAGYIKDLRDVFQRQNLHFLSTDRMPTVKPFMGTAYRGVKLLQWKEQYKIEREFVWPAFTSTSTDVEVAMGNNFAGDSSGVLFEIHCCNMPLPAHCYVPVDISHVSYFGGTDSSESEKEVLFPPHVRFRVSNIDTKDTPVRIILETVECPSVWDIIKARDWTLFEEWADKNSRRMNTADCDSSIINQVAKACAESFQTDCGTLKPLEICVSKGADLEELDPESNDTPLDKLVKAAEVCPDSTELQDAVKWIQDKQEYADVFKVVALVNGRLYSIFDGVTEYVVGKRLESPQKAKPAYKGGLYVESTAERAMRSRFPQQSKLLLAPRVLIGCRAHGKRIEFDDGQIAVSGLTPLEVLAIETATQLMPNVKAREKMSIDYTEWIAIPPGSPLQQYFRSADSNGFQDLAAVTAVSTMTEQKELLAAVDAKIQEAKNLQRLGEVRKAVQLLQRAYRKTESSEAPVGFGNNGSIASKLGKGLVRLQLAIVYSSMSKHREALEEAVYAMLETDAAWQAMLASAGAGRPKKSGAENEAAIDESPPPSAAATPAVVLAALLQKPPPWLERASELSVRTRCRASSELRAAFSTAVAEAAAEDIQVEVTDRKEEARRQALGLSMEAEMLARHFLPKDHPVRRHAERELQELEAGWEDPEPTNTEDLSRPATSPSTSKLPPIARLVSSQRLPADGDPRVMGARAMSQPNFRATTGAWNGYAPNGDMYYTTLPKSNLPRIAASGRKRRAAQNVTEGQLKRAEGCAGGMTRSASAILAPQGASTNPFKDWQSSFDDPTKHDKKRMVMRSDEAARRFKGELKHESYHFKSRILPMFSSDEIYEARVKYSGYGMRASKIGERLQIQWDKQYHQNDLQKGSRSPGKNETKRDLFRRYGVELKGEPNLSSLRRLMEESAKGRPRKEGLRSSMMSDMQGVFRANKIKATEPEPDSRAKPVVARQWEDDDDLMFGSGTRSGLEVEVEEAVVDLYQQSLTRTAALGAN